MPDTEGCVIEIANLVADSWRENPDYGEPGSSGVVVYMASCALCVCMCRVMGDVNDGKLTNIRVEVSSDRCLRDH